MSRTNTAVNTLRVGFKLGPAGPVVTRPRLKGDQATAPRAGTTLRRDGPAGGLGLDASDSGSHCLAGSAVLLRRCTGGTTVSSPGSQPPGPAELNPSQRAKGRTVSGNLHNGCIGLRWQIAGGDPLPSGR
jgi:hypothetical protein